MLPERWQEVMEISTCMLKKWGVWNPDLIADTITHLRYRIHHKGKQPRLRLVLCCLRRAQRDMPVDCGMGTARVAKPKTALSSIGKHSIHGRREPDPVRNAAAREPVRYLASRSLSRLEVHMLLAYLRRERWDELASRLGYSHGHVKSAWWRFCDRQRRELGWEV